MTGVRLYFHKETRQAGIRVERESQIKRTGLRVGNFEKDSCFVGVTWNVFTLKKYQF